MAEVDFDVVVFGATGFTGRLVAEYLAQGYGTEGRPLRWAMAGRSQDKLERVRGELGVPSVPLIVADSGDRASLEAMAGRTKVVCTTVGPYALYGSELVDVCATTGTDYCDLTGEVPWMREMIDAHQATAEQTGARIVHACGFDCIPADLGVLFLQDAMMAARGVYATHVKYRVVRMRGGTSGGTAASAIHLLEQVAREPRIRELVADPYALDPPGSPRGNDVDDARCALYDPDFEQWTLPFVMAPVDTRVVRRSHALMGHRYGADFRFDEALFTRMGGVGARLAGWGMAATLASLTLGPVRALAKLLLPSPGEGPSREARERGSFEALLYGVHPQDRALDLVARVTGDRDPGYGSTAKMLGEAAVCLATDALPTPGGVWTPATAMGAPLVQRLQERAGLTFSLVGDRP